MIDPQTLMMIQALQGQGQPQAPVDPNVIDMAARRPKPAPAPVPTPLPPSPFDDYGRLAEMLGPGIPMAARAPKGGKGGKGKPTPTPLPPSPFDTI